MTRLSNTTTNRLRARAIPEGYKYYAPKVEQPKYSEEFYKAIINQTGDKLKVY